MLWVSHPLRSKPLLGRRAPARVTVSHRLENKLLVEDKLLVEVELPHEDKPLVENKTSSEDKLPEIGTCNVQLTSNLISSVGPSQHFEPALFHNEEERYYPLIRHHLAGELKLRKGAALREERYSGEFFLWIVSLG